MKVAFLGTGLLGSACVLRLHTAGLEVVAHNRSPEKLRPLEAAGVPGAATAAGALESCEVVLLMLTDAAAIRDVLLEDPACRRALAGRAVVQMGTIAPHQSQALAEEFAALGAEYLEAPVLGSRPEAAAGRLQVLVGGPDELCERLRPVLEALGPVRRLGPVGAAAQVKLALNQIIASQVAALGASLGLLVSAGADPGPFLEILRASALWAPTFERKLPSLLAQDFHQANFPLRHLLKDLSLFLDEAGRQEMHVPQLNGLRELLQAGLRAGLDDQDYASLYLAMLPQPPTD